MANNNGFSVDRPHHLTSEEIDDRRVPNSAGQSAGSFMQHQRPVNESSVHLGDFEDQKQASSSMRSFTLNNTA
jgi:hypothetical protein